EMLEHRMVGEPDLAGDADALRLGLHALKLDAVVELVDFDAIEHAEKVEMPERAAKLAIGGKLQPYVLLLLDDPGDLTILDRLQLGTRFSAFLLFAACLLERRGAEEAADMGGGKRRLGAVLLAGPLKTILARARPRRASRRQPKNDGESSRL